MFRLGFLTSHPIQYQAPLFRELANRDGIDLEVLFCSRRGANQYFDPEFATNLRWNVPLLTGYKHRFLSLEGADPHWLSGHVNVNVVAAVQSGRFDALVIHGWRHLTNLLAITRARMKGMPILLRGESHLKAPVPMYKLVAKQVLLRTLFKQVAAFLAIGSENSAFYEHHGVHPSRIFLAPYAIDNNLFSVASQQARCSANQLRSKLGIDPAIPVILFCGKLIPKKRPLDLLAAFVEVVRHQDAALLFVGAGTEHARLEAAARQQNLDRVYFVGFQNQDELPAYYAISDIFVLPSAFEPWGLVVNEAMACQLPIITSDRVGCAVDLVRPGENGFTYPFGNVKILAKQLSKLVSDHRLRTQMGERSREIISKWGIKQSVDGIVRAIRSIQPCSET